MRIIDQSGRMSIPSEYYIIFISHTEDGCMVCAESVFDPRKEYALAFYANEQRAEKLFQIIINDEMAGSKVCNISTKMI